MVVVDDDVALAATGGHAGRRGLAGTVLVHKIAGAAAAQGRSLVELKRIAERAISELGTMGVALTPCTVPAAGRPGFSLGRAKLNSAWAFMARLGCAADILPPPTRS